MRLLKAGLKTVLLPVFLALTLIQWASIIVISCSKMVTRLASILLLLIAFIGYLVNPNAVRQAVNIGVLAVEVLLLPHLAEWLIYRITDLNLSLRQFFRSKP